MTRVTIELEYEQIDAIICTQLKEHIVMTIKSIDSSWCDHTYERALLDAMWVVYAYYVGEEVVEALKKELNV
jgi:hypothetical protein